MFPSTSVHDRVVDIVAKQFSLARDKVDMDQPFWGHYGADSLDMVELIMDVVDEFELDIPAEEAEKIKTPADLVLVVNNGGKYPAHLPEESDEQMSA